MTNTAPGPSAGRTGEQQATERTSGQPAARQPATEQLATGQPAAAGQPATGQLATGQAEERTELGLLLLQRATIYRFLSRLFRVEVNQELLDELKTTSFPGNTGNAKMDKGYHLLASYLGASWANTTTELAVDYFKVFIGNGVDAYSAAYPYESVYTSVKRLLMQEARDKVRSCYHQAGLTKLESWREGEDHLALELEFLAILSERTHKMLTQATKAASAPEAEAPKKEASEAEASEKEALQLLESQRFFLLEHLCAWVPLLTNDMRRFATTDFYQGLSWLTEGFLELDREFLESVLSEDS